MKAYQKAVFLDRDGTINVEKNYLYRVEDFEFLPGVMEALKNFQEKGYLLVIITNQSGIARGYYTEDDFNKLNTWMLKKFQENGIEIAEVYYCPHHPDAIIEKYRIECDCRKPKLGMFYKAIEDLNIDINRSIAIGDKIRDCAIAETTGCRGFLVGDNENEDIVQAIKLKKHTRFNITFCSDMEDVLKNIVN